jgi:calpain-15
MGPCARPGDCWLLSAFACLAEFEGAVKKAFVNTTFSVYGQYRVRLWCKLKQRWTVVTVDDCFPCKKGSAKPMFADPHGTELWVLVLEKAFAKFVGTYGCDRPLLRLLLFVPSALHCRARE